MKTIHKTHESVSDRQSLLLLCRFLTARFSYRLFILLHTVTGLLFSVTGQSRFAPYGIALVCLLLPSFLNLSDTTSKKENNATALSILYQRYHYSPVAFSGYRISLLSGMFLLLAWHMLQKTVLSLFGVSLPLLYLVLFLALYPLLSRVLFFFFHRRLMNGIM